jgi:hypothetical protein
MSTPPESDADEFLPAGLSEQMMASTTKETDDDIGGRRNHDLAGRVHHGAE